MENKVEGELLGSEAKLTTARSALLDFMPDGKVFVKEDKLRLNVQIRTSRSSKVSSLVCVEKS